MLKTTTMSKGKKIALGIGLLMLLISPFTCLPAGLIGLHVYQVSQMTKGYKTKPAPAKKLTKIVILKSDQTSGTTFRPAMAEVHHPAKPSTTGIAPKYIRYYNGRRLKTDLPAGTVLTPNHFE